MGPDKRLRPRPGLSVADVACLKAVNESIGPAIRRADIAVRPVARQPGVGVVVGPAIPGGPVNAARFAAGNNVGAIGDGFPWSFWPNPPRSCPRQRLPPLAWRARASAQQQFPKIFRLGAVSDRVATSGSSSHRSGRRNGFVVPCAAGRYSASSIGKSAIGSGAVPVIGPRADRRGHRRNPRRDVVSDCEGVPACLRSLHPTPRRQRAGPVFPGPPVPSPWVWGFGG